MTPSLPYKLLKNMTEEGKSKVDKIKWLILFYWIDTLNLPSVERILPSK